MTDFILAGDIGGTNSRFQIFTAGSRDPIYTNWYSNLEHFKVSFIDVVQVFFKDLVENTTFKSMSPENVTIVGSFACAGPVANNKVVMTNIGEWAVIDGAEMEKCEDGWMSALKRSKIVNDFVGQGYGALDLNVDDPKEGVFINGGKTNIDPLGPKAMLGAGTGLGECYLTISSLNPESGYECYPSEGGHVEFAPRDDMQVEMVNFIKAKYGENHRISAERIVSGRGLANVYDFLSQKYPEKRNEAIYQEFLVAKDLQGKVVGVNQKNCELCALAGEIFASAYGSEAGSCALKWIPTGGLFVSGGLTGKNMNLIEGVDSPFMKAYFDKGRLSGLVKKIPVFACMTEDLGLRGARVCAQREYDAFKKR